MFPVCVCTVSMLWLFEGEDSRLRLVHWAPWTSSPDPDLAFGSYSEFGVVFKRERRAYTSVKRKSE